MIVLTHLLLRPGFRALANVTTPMRTIDPLARVDASRASASRTWPVWQALNEMQERLEHERRESARQALMVQEAERQRVARQLHDEVGQVLTAIMLQTEGMAAHARNATVR